MKKLIAFIMFLSFCFNYGAIKDNIKGKEVTLSKKFIGVEIASFDFKDTKDLNENSDIYFNMLFSYEDLNKMINEYSKQYNITEKHYIESRIESINGVAYLRSYTEDGYVTTTALKPSYSESRDSMVLQLEGISCTSKSCAENDGCIPNKQGLGCTPCSWGDCTKTVTRD